MINNSDQSKVRLRDFSSNDGYSKKVGKLTEIIWYMIKVFFFLSAIPYPNKFKVFLLRVFGAKVGKRVNIKPRVNFHMPWNLEIGNDVWIGEEVFILNFERVILGNDVCISQRTFLCGGNHDFKDPAFRYRNGPITLEDGVWVGASCFVGPQVVIGTDTVVVAGSIVTSSLKPNGIYRGNPAIYIKSRWL
jgi:putative colanic acid biosynthesis acetyltransferase WcaF